MPDPFLAQVDASFAPARAECVYTVEIDGEAVLLDESVNRLHLLNSTASLVWRLLDGDASIAEMARELSEELATAYDTVLADTLEIVRNLGEENHRVEGAPPQHVRASTPDRPVHSSIVRTWSAAIPASSPSSPRFRTISSVSASTVS
jgi:hypothetical protein